MTCHAARGTLWHLPSFSVPAPSGYAECERCRRLVTMAQWLEEVCPGTQAEAAAPMPANAVPCRLCAAPVTVESRHRTHVEEFGTLCDACFEMPPTENPHAAHQLDADRWHGRA